MPYVAYNTPPLSDPRFPNGERGISPFPGLTGYGIISFNMARRIQLRPGRYTITVLARQIVTFFIGSSLDSQRQLMTVTGAMDGQTFEFVVFEGESRFGFSVLNYRRDVETEVFAVFTIKRGGEPVYVSNAAGWLYEQDAFVRDVDLQGDALTPSAGLPVFSILPNWKDGMLERLEWLTDILTSETTIEQRRALRTMPRRSLEASFLRDRSFRSMLANLLVGVGENEMLVPLWFEQHRLRVPLPQSALSANFPAGTLANREFRVGDLVLVQNKDPALYDVIRITAINLSVDIIYWQPATPLSRTWSAGVRLTPLRRARIIDKPSLRNLTDGVATAQIRFEMTDPEPGFGAPSSTDLNVLPFKPNWNDDLTVDVTRTVFSQDNGIATPFFYDPSDMSQVGQSFTHMIKGRANAVMFRRFLSMARGRAVRFYVPSFTNDIYPVDQTIQGFFFGALYGAFAKAMQTRQNACRFIEIVFNNGSPPIYREVVAVEVTGTENEFYFFNTELPAIAVSSIRRISWLRPSRFDQDGFEIKHYTDDSAVLSTALVIASVDDTGMATIN